MEIEHLLNRVRTFAQEQMGKETAHDYSHAYRVGVMARKIAEKEGLGNTHLYEIAGLLHDVGLGVCERKNHGEVGAVIAEKFLKKFAVLPKSDCKEIVYAIAWHNRKLLAPKGSVMLDVLADADTIDLLGAVGIWRGIQSNPQTYFPSAKRLIQSKTDFAAYDSTFANKRVENSHSIEEQLNFQIESAKILTTNTAKQLAEPLVTTMKVFRYMVVNELLQVEL